jgi:hypothetical protein
MEENVDSYDKVMIILDELFKSIDLYHDDNKEKDKYKIIYKKLSQLLKTYGIEISNDDELFLKIISSIFCFSLNRNLFNIEGEYCSKFFFDLIRISLPIAFFGNIFIEKGNLKISELLTKKPDFTLQLVNY